MFKPSDNYADREGNRDIPCSVLDGRHVHEQRVPIGNSEIMRSFTSPLLRKVGMFVFMLSVALSAPASRADSAFSTDGPLPLRLEDAHKVFDQCSRTAPSPGNELWLPSAIQIQRLEEELDLFLPSIYEPEFQNLETRLGEAIDKLDQGSSLSEVERRLALNDLEFYRNMLHHLELTGLQAQEYRGYHVGYTRNEVDYIYASYVNDRHFGIKGFPLLTGEVVVVCDGRYSSWGIVYNVQTSQLTNFRANGGF